MTPEYPTPRKRIFDALQRCEDGLTADDLARIGYGTADDEALNLVRTVIWRLRQHADIETVPTRYRLRGMR